MLHYGNVRHCTFSHLLLELLVQYLNGGQHNYFRKPLIVYRIMGGAGSKCVISTTQGDSMINYVQHSKMCVQEATSQYDGISDWQDKTLLCKKNTFNC